MLRELKQRIEELEEALRLIMANEQRKILSPRHSTWTYEICDKALNYPKGKTNHNCHTDLLTKPKE